MKNFIEKYMYKYRGKRIRYRTKDSIKRVGFSIGIPTFLLAFFYLSLVLKSYPAFTPTFSIEGFKEWILAVEWFPLFLSFVLAMIVTGFLLLGLKILFFEKFTFMKHRQKLARFIIDRGWYSTTSVDQEGFDVLGMFDFENKRSATVKKKEKVDYFPKVFYQVKKDYIYIRFPLDGMKNQNQFVDVANELEQTLFSELVKQELEEGYICYQFVYAIHRDRLNIHDLVAKDGKLPLMKRSVWDFDKLPHMLISGGTGAGKTYVILSVMLGLVKGDCKKEDIYIADPKNADLADLEGIFPNVYSQKNGIKMVIDKFRKAMQERARTIKELPNYETGKNYRYFGLRPQFLIFDEIVAFMEMLDYKEREEVLSNLKQIVMLGRQAGFYLIGGLQRPDAKYLADGIRDQFHYRIALGKNSEVGYGMMFGDVDKKFSQKEIVGFGYADAGKGVISEFYSPYVPTDFNFIEAFKKVE
ncbi:cell division protein FtsK [Listeria aquatica]|uniref:cell division protein FtsK n=1 Tax=Listeria aquatica TaxID=1494960 RepID=UPI003F6FAD81